MSRRVPLLAAVVFAVLFASSLVLSPPVGIDTSGTVLVSRLSEHVGAVRLQALLIALGTLALAVLLGWAHGRLDGPAAFVFTVGSAVMLVEISISLWFGAGLALHGSKADPATVRTVSDVAALFGPILTVADVMVATPIVLAAAARRFPRWLGVLGAIFAVEQLVEVVTVVGPAGSFIAPGGPMNFYLGGPLFIAFFLGVGIASSQRSDTATETETRA